jgi:hypothetical protein
MRLARDGGSSGRARPGTGAPAKGKHERAAYSILGDGRAELFALCSIISHDHPAQIGRQNSTCAGRSRMFSAADAGMLGSRQSVHRGEGVNRSRTGKNNYGVVPEPFSAGRTIGRTPQARGDLGDESVCFGYRIAVSGRTPWQRQLKDRATFAQNRKEDPNHAIGRVSGGYTTPEPGAGS